MDNKTRFELQRKLQPYAEVCEDELGEAIGLLLQIMDYGYIFSSSFNDAVEQEARGRLKYFEENTIIRQKTYQQERTIFELVYLENEENKND